MALRRCDRGHHFDPQRYTRCPSCGVLELALTPEPVSDGRLAASRAVVVPLEPRSNLKDRPTMGWLERRLGIDPVVGWLVCIAGPDRGRDYRIRSERNTIGRGSQMEVALLSDESVSREPHAIVSYDPTSNRFSLIPSSGRWLVFLNGAEVVEPRPLEPRDVIELGNTRLLFVPFCDDGFRWID